MQYSSTDGGLSSIPTKLAKLSSRKTGGIGAVVKKNTDETLEMSHKLSFLAISMNDNFNTIVSKEQTSNGDTQPE